MYTHVHVYMGSNEYHYNSQGCRYACIYELSISF